ncbi:MAG: nucleotidyltransferase domain-containing protein [Desulfonatronovibrio sp.]
MAQNRPPQKILKYIKHLRKSYPGLKKAYIFGSFAKGSSGSDSDIDIALVFDTVADAFDLQIELMKIRRKYDSRIEPHVFRISDFDKSHPMAGEVITTGMEIPG